MNPSHTTSVHGSKPWQAFYLLTLANLRSTWPHAWPGLPTVLQSCINRLWQSNPPQPKSTGGQMLSVASAVASRMEVLASEAAYEPRYHNRLHTADALTAMCLLIQALQETHFSVDDEWAAALLLAVTAHDVLHPGGANAFLQEFEQRSVTELQITASAYVVDSVWLQRVKAMILRTDPTLVSDNHDRVKHSAFEMNLDWACVLLNEADILASATALYGPALGEALALEWALKNHPLHHVVGTPSGRRHFLSSLRFSTPASETFGMAASVEQQIKNLPRT